MIAVIPARYSSVRLPGKMLLPIARKPLILHTLDRTRAALNVGRVIVATDDARIRDVVRSAGAEALMTSPEHRSGSDRVAEVAERLPGKSILVNVQGDEPLISPRTVEMAVEAMRADASADVITVCERFESADEILDYNNVKVVLDSSGFALYFSRLPIPHLRESVNRYGSLGKALELEPELIGRFRKHTGLYVYRREYLIEFAGKAQSSLEKCEVLEQLRALEQGARIRVVETGERSIGVDTAEDLERVRMLLAG